MSNTSGHDIKYKPLSSHLSSPVRLLVVLPGSGDDDIQCQLHQASLYDKTEPFEALSYTWGDEMCPRPILIDGTPVLATSNLEAALRCLRKPTERRTLWVDAVCINQKDLDEKLGQIKQMGLVYELAQRVVVWLGPAADSSDLAMEFAGTLFNIWTKDHPTISGHEEMESNRIDWVPYADQLCTPRYAAEMVATAKLLMRSWWSRAWIVQEFLSNDSVLFHCGTSSKSLGPIRGLVGFWGWVYGNQRLKDFQESFLNLNFARPYQLVNDLMHVRSELYDPDSGPRDQIATLPGAGRRSASFLRALSITRGRGCQYPHDRIFSILGIVDTHIKDSINVDYKQSPEKLYSQVLKIYLGITNNLDIICNSQPTGASSSFPSWLPDWNLTRRARIYGDESRTHNIPIKAAGTSRATAEVDDDGTLTALGLRIGTITSVGWEENFPLCATGTEGPGWWVFSESAPWFVQPLLEGILKRDHESVQPLLGGERVFAALLYEAHRSPKSGQEVLDSSSPLVETWKKWSSLFGSTTWNRTVYITKEGHIGLALSTARPGDELCILFGCTAPVVLRRHDDGSHTFIGDSFVHGIMDGEMMEEFEMGDREAVTFRLK